MPLPFVPGRYSIQNTKMLRTQPTLKCIIKTVWWGPRTSEFERYHFRKQPDRTWSWHYMEFLGLSARSLSPVCEMQKWISTVGVLFETKIIKLSNHLFLVILLITSPQQSTHFWMCRLLLCASLFVQVIFSIFTDFLEILTYFSYQKSGF